MKIQVNIPEITLDTVVAEIVRVDEDGDEYPEGTSTVADKVAKIIANEVMRKPEYAALRERVTNTRQDMIREALAPILAEALQKPLYKTNTYGERTGQTTTLTEVIMEEARQAWALSKNSYGSRQDTINEIIAAEVKKQITGEIQKAVKATQVAALKAVGDLAAAPVVEAVKQALGK